MKNKLTILTAMIALVAVFTLAACGKPSLEKWYANNATEFEALESSVNSEDVGCTLEIKVVDDNVLVFNYAFTSTFDTSDSANVDALSQVYDATFERYAPTFSEIRTQALDESSTEDIVIRLVVSNPDGTELYSRDFAE